VPGFDSVVLSLDGVELGVEESVAPSPPQLHTTSNDIDKTRITAKKIDILFKLFIKTSL
jgi:hypothetical protein